MAGDIDPRMQGDKVGAWLRNQANRDWNEVDGLQTRTRDRFASGDRMTYGLTLTAGSLP